MQGAMVSGPIMATPSGVCTLLHAITKQSELPYYCTSVIVDDATASGGRPRIHHCYGTIELHIGLRGQLLFLRPSNRLKTTINAIVKKPVVI